MLHITNYIRQTSLIDLPTIRMYHILHDTKDKTKQSTTKRRSHMFGNIIFKRRKELERKAQKLKEDREELDQEREEFEQERELLLSENDRLKLRVRKLEVLLEYKNQEEKLPGRKPS